MTRTLCLVPGTQCDARVWAPVRRLLEPRIGGLHLAIERETSRAGMLDAFSRAADAHGPLHIAAFSMGGYLSLQFALEHPGRVASLALVCSSAFGLTAEEAAGRVRMIETLETHPYRGMSVARMNQFIHLSRRDDPGVAGVIKAMDADLGRDVLLAQMRETSTRQSLEDRLGGIACPVLLIGADSDPFVPVERIARMQALIPGAQAAVAKDAGHMIPLEQPEWLAERLRAFHEAIA